MRFIKIAFLLCSCSLIYACAVNPVTGKNELALIGEQSEISMGTQQYMPTIQAQGGIYDKDAALTRYVNEVGQRLAAHSDRKLPYEFVIVNSSQPNAWALPGGKLAINRGMLLEMSSEAELAAVLSHEIVHAAAGHSRKQLQNNQLLSIGMSVLQAGLSSTSYGGLAMQGANLGAKIINSQYSQGQESEADAYGIKYMYNAGFNTEGAVRIQQTFLRLSQQRGAQSSALATLFSSHPPSAARVAANKRLLTQYPAKGDLGVAQYQRAITTIKRAQPAYDIFDKGVEATAQKDYKRALEYANQAIQRYSAEGAFYELRGFSQEQLQQTQAALSSYASAIQKSPNFYSPYYRRGLLHKKQNNKSAAEADLLKSYKLLPHPAIKKAILELRGS